MKITFHGAAQEVTGSCYLIECGRQRVLVDCGLIQGEREDEARNAEPFPFDPACVDAVVLSHAHLDHSGRIPLLLKAGFKGDIYTQRASRDLCRIMLKDAGFINEKDVEWENRKRQRKGLALLEPLYTVKDAQDAMHRFKGLDYDVKRKIAPGISMRLRDAGHILGSAIVELWLEEGGERRKLLFSGDLGHHGAPILRDPAVISEPTDLVVMESTYGDRNHRSWEQTWEEIGSVIREAERGKGNILIPSFAVGRSQELLYMFAKHFEAWGLEHWQIFLDSPMAIEATEVYMKHTNLYDREAAKLWLHGDGPLLPNLHISRTPNQSMAINTIRSGAIIIAGSGMCSGGRIRHHFKHNIWRRDTHLLMVGFQARGTLGRALVDGAKKIRLWGEEMQVNVQLHTIGGLSAHADQRGLLRWYQQIPGRPKVALTHGEPEAIEALAAELAPVAKGGVVTPAPGSVINLLAS